MAYIKRKKLILADGIANSEIQIGQKDKSVNISVSETEVNIDKSLNVNGNVSVQTPTEDAHAVNLGYLNAELNKKLDTEDSGAHIIGEETETNVVAETTLNFTLDAGTGLYRTVDNAITIADWDTYRQMPVAKFKVTFDGVEYVCYINGDYYIGFYNSADVINIFITMLICGTQSCTADCFYIRN